MLYNKYGSVSPKKRFMLLCLPLAAAVICTACNNAYAVNITDGGISYDNTYSQTESTSADTDKTTSQIKEEEPLPVPEPRCECHQHPQREGCQRYHQRFGVDYKGRSQ